MMAQSRKPYRISRWLACLGLVVLGTLATGPRQVAQAQTATTCNVANSKGTDGPVDWGAYCWISFQSYSASQATGSGQNFVVTLPGGATLAFKLKVSANNIVPANVPTWSGAAFGNVAFSPIPGNPVLYHNVNGVTTTITLSNLNLSANGSPDLPFVFVAADGESTNNGETLSFTTAGAAWQLVDSPGQGSGRPLPNLTGTGTTTVTETGNTDGATGSYVFTTDNSPGTVTATMHGSGLQGVLFGLKFHSIDLAVTKTYSGQAYPGGTGSYALDVSNTVTANQRPPTDPQPIQVIDTLPSGVTYTGFSGTNWSCSNSGQVVTCNLPAANLNTTPNTTVHMPLLTLNVSIDNNAQTTLVNSATVQDVTTGYVFDTNQSNNSTSQTLNIIHPDLSTSTKTVQDLNGGDADPGDTLQYTITLKESAGAPASNLSVIDDMPPGVTGLSVVSTPAGSTNASTTSGGINGTGKVNVTGISVPANGSVTIVYNVSIAASDSPGYTIDNSATVNNPSGPGATPPSSTVTVSQSQYSPPAKGSKILYVYDDLHLTRIPQAASNSAGVQVSAGGTRDWTLSPAIATGKTLVIPSGTIITFSLVTACTGSQCTYNCGFFGCSHRNSDVSVELLNGTTSLGTSDDQTFNSGTPSTRTFSIKTSGATTVPANGHLVMRVHANSSYFQNYQDATVSQYYNGASTITFYTSTVINVDSVSIYSVPYTNSPNTTTKAAYNAGDTLYVRAVISDPFGSCDVNHATIKIVDASGTTRVNNGSMSQVVTDTCEGSTVATRTFEYPYVLPAGATSGTWVATITGYEGRETTVDQVTHTRGRTFVVAVPLPNLTVMKAVFAVSDPVEGTTRPKALPGATMRYQITVANNGAGTADANTLVVTDPIPADTKFVLGSATFANGTTSSGLSMTAANVTYSSNGGTSYLYVPVADGSGADPQVTNVKFSPTGTMAAKTGTDAPSFTINFNVIIK